MLRHALRLAKRGLAIVPCWPRTKQPATAHGIKDASCDTAQIEIWWRAEPNYNIAVVLGAPSNLIALDIDGLDAEAALRALEQSNSALPRTIETTTPRPGRHIYFRRPARPVPSSRGRLGADIEVKSDGTCCLLPPSVHPTGALYHWSVDCGPGFADAPPWLLDRICAPASGNGHAPTPPAVWRELVTAGVAEGARNDSATRFAGYLLRHYLDPFVVLEVLQLWNAVRCAPPLPEADIARIVDSISCRELKRRGYDQ
jgi:bifunctional DNA primase/polymerase-like protein/primase-like protein